MCMMMQHEKVISDCQVLKLYVTDDIVDKTFLKALDSHELGFSSKAGNMELKKDAWLQDQQWNGISGILGLDHINAVVDRHIRNV